MSVTTSVICTEKRAGKDIIEITLASGPQKPYYISQYGMSLKVYFIRKGSVTLPVTVEMIDEPRDSRSVKSLNRPLAKLNIIEYNRYYEI